MCNVMHLFYKLEHVEIKIYFVSITLCCIQATPSVFLVHASQKACYAILIKF